MNYVNSQQIADTLGVSRSTVSRWETTGKIPEAAEINSVTGTHWWTHHQFREIVRWHVGNLRSERIRKRRII